MASPATIFDGIVPASANPGVDPGAVVLVWTPSQSGIYSLLISAPDEPGAPFFFADNVLVDLGAPVPGIQFEPQLVGNISDEFQQEGPFPGPSLSLETFRGVPARAVVKVGLIASSDVVAGEPSIVSLEELKRALGIELTETGEDQLLVELEQRAAAWVTEQLERNFGQPNDRVEYAEGNGQRQLWLRGHVEAPGVVTVRSRALAGGDWQAFAGFELRGDSLVRTDGYRWSPAEEYELTYPDGYAAAPGDIKALVIELVSGGRDYTGGAVAEVKSESIGDYSYTLDTAAAVAVSGLSSRGADTINRRRRKHI